MSALNMPGDEGGIGGDVSSGQEDVGEEHGGDIGPDDQGADGDLNLGPALAPPG